MQYTTVLHDVRKQLGLSCNEYCIADMIDLLSTNPAAPVPGWCSQSRGHMATEMGLSRRTVIDIVTTLMGKGLVDKNADDLLRTTPRWQAAVAAGQAEIETKRSQKTGCAESSHPVQNLHGGCAESSQDECAESSHNNKSIDNKTDNTAATANAGAHEAEDTFFSVDAEKPPNTPVAAAPLSPKKVVYGDGELQKKVRQYFRTNPAQYPEGMYPEFIAYYTAPVDTQNKPSEQGQERWRTLNSWNLERKLDLWYPGYLRDREKEKHHESATGKNGTQLTAGHHPGPGSRQVARPATIKPGMFNRGGQGSRNAHSESGRRTIRIDVDPDHPAA